jgi:hypothetical protein
LLNALERSGSRVFQGLVTQLKIKLSRAIKAAACATIALTGAMLAVCFFGAAGFVWLSHQYGLINACLVFGGLFVLVALIAGFVLAVLRRRAPAQPAKARLAPLADPKLVAIGLEIVRALNGRRVGPAGLIGAFIVGILLSRGTSEK